MANKSSIAIVKKYEQELMNLNINGPSFLFLLKKISKDFFFDLKNNEEVINYIKDYNFSILLDEYGNIASDSNAQKNSIVFGYFLILAATEYGIETVLKNLLPHSISYKKHSKLNPLNWLRWIFNKISWIEVQLNTEATDAAFSRAIDELNHYVTTTRKVHAFDQNLRNSINLIIQKISVENQVQFTSSTEVLAEQSFQSSLVASSASETLATTLPPVSLPAKIEEPMMLAPLAAPPLPPPPPPPQFSVSKSNDSNVASNQSPQSIQVVPLVQTLKPAAANPKAEKVTAPCSVVDELQQRFANKQRILRETKQKSSQAELQEKKSPKDELKELLNKLDVVKSQLETHAQKPGIPRHKINVEEIIKKEKKTQATLGKLQKELTYLESLAVQLKNNPNELQYTFQLHALFPTYYRGDSDSDSDDESQTKSPTKGSPTFFNVTQASPENMQASLQRSCAVR
jgi:hypothetical protein